VHKSVGELELLESDFGLHTSKPYQLFSERVERICRDVRNEVSKATTRGAAAYGSSVGCAALINQFQIGADLAFMVDDNPFKKVLVGPDYRLEVLDRNELAKRNPAIVLVLAWRYVKPIAEKNLAYLEKGGRFVVPLPKVTHFGH